MPWSVKVSIQLWPYFTSVGRHSTMYWMQEVHIFILFVLCVKSVCVLFLISLFLKGGLTHTMPCHWRFKDRFTHTMPFPCRDSATTLPFYESALFHTGHCIWDWYASDKLPGTRNDKSWTCCRDHAMALRGCFRQRHIRGMACVNQTRLHCVNQMRNTQSKALVEQHGMCESVLIVSFCGLSHSPIAASVV
jgi:hypothetical protein